MAKRPTTDPALRDLKQELLRTTDALKARCNYLLRRIKELSGEAVPSAIPRARPVQAAAAAASAPEEAPCMAAGAMKGGDTCRS